MKKTTKPAAVDSGKEHENLVFLGASVLPSVIAERLQNMESLAVATRQNVIDSKWENQIEESIQKKKLTNAEQITLWRAGIAATPSFAPLDLASVEYGYSLYDHCKMSSQKPARRLGMVDMKLTWAFPLHDYARVNCWSSVSDDNAISDISQVFKLELCTASLYAIAIVESTPLGVVLERMEKLKEFSVLNAEGRMHDRPRTLAWPILAITTRPRIFEALITQHDALLVESEKVTSYLGSTTSIMELVRKLGY